MCKEDQKILEINFKREARLTALKYAASPDFRACVDVAEAQEDIVEKAERIYQWLVKPL